jgi:hypothetical protein
MPTFHPNPGLCHDPWMSIPSSILLLHGLGGSGEGSVKLLEQRLRGSGWGETTYLRPTLSAIHRPEPGKPMDRVFVQAWDELNAILAGRVPHLCVGFSFGGLLAPFAPSPLRLSVCSPWGRLPSEAYQRAASREGWQVLQGSQDTVVPADEHLAVLPERVPRTLDPAGSHDFDAWMDRIAAWVMASWENHLIPATSGPPR